MPDKVFSVDKFLGINEYADSETELKPGQAAMMRNFRIIVTKEQLLLKVWGYDSDAEDNNVEVYISFLRRKLAHLHSAVKIRTIRLVGYCLEV